MLMMFVRYSTAGQMRFDQSMACYGRKSQVSSTISHSYYLAAILSFRRSAAILSIPGQPQEDSGDHPL